jgi:uncharacterized membrane protein YtjA (UPF0391 family)
MQMYVALQPLVALIAGILILMIPRLLNYIVAIYLIVIGILGLVRMWSECLITEPWANKWAQNSESKFRGKEDMSMLNWAVTFLVIALIAGLLGLSGVAGAATQIAWILFVVFLILFVVGMVMGRRPPA